MRVKKLFVVLDKRAKTIVGHPHMDYNHVSIQREVAEAVNKPGTILNRAPEDFVLLEIGHIDEETGQLLGEFYDADGQTNYEPIINTTIVVAQLVALVAREQ